MKGHEMTELRICIYCYNRTTEGYCANCMEYKSLVTPMEMLEFYPDEFHELGKQGFWNE